jgi:PHD finger-like domain-containing protein 5A
MSRHHPDLVMCRKQPGIAVGRVCDKCDGKCPVCDSYVRPTTLVRICDECSFGNYMNKCVVCGGEGISDAFYCFECTRLEKDRDGCPKIINLGSSRTDVCALQSCPIVLYMLLYTNFLAALLPKENKSNTILAPALPGSGCNGGQDCCMLCWFSFAFPCSLPLFVYNLRSFIWFSCFHRRYRIQKSAVYSCFDTHKGDDRNKRKRKEERKEN